MICENKCIVGEKRAVMLHINNKLRGSVRSRSEVVNVDMWTRNLSSIEMYSYTSETLLRGDESQGARRCCVDERRVDARVRSFWLVGDLYNQSYVWLSQRICIESDITGPTALHRAQARSR
jgi:hypothetical protein